MKRRFIAGLVILSIAMFVLGGCTTRKNFTGSENSHTTPIIAYDSLLIDYVSYEDSCRSQSSNTKLYYGLLDSIRVVSMVQFTGFSLPDSFEIVPGSGRIRLQFNSTDTTHAIVPQIRIPEALWVENELTWKQSETDTPWSDLDHNWPIVDVTPTIVEDTLFISVPDSLLLTWVQDDSLNRGIALFPPDIQGYDVLVSDDGDEVPLLEFEYTEGGEQESYSLYSVNAAFMYEQHGPGTNPMAYHGIASVMPTRTYVKFDLTPDIMVGLLGVENADELRRTTINKAEVVFKMDLDGCRLVDNSVVSKSYFMKTPVTVYPISYADFVFKSYPTYMQNYSLYVQGQETFKIDVTPSVQAILAGLDVNNGFVLLSVGENRELNRLVFDETVQPVLKIMYTKFSVGD